MNLIALLGLSVTLVVIALWAMARDGGSRLYGAISAIPLLLTVVIPLPFSLAVRNPAGWPRTTVVTISRIGIVLSFALFAIGVVLTLRAAKVRDRRAVIVLALETALAALPAVIVTAYAALFRFL